MGDAIARTRDDGHRQALHAHLYGVGERAAASADKINATVWCRLAGLLHDLGKYRPGFQHYIRQTKDAHCETNVMPRDRWHSTAGALWAMENLRVNNAGRILAYVIAGHHAGLYDWEELKTRLESEDARVEMIEAMEAAPIELFGIDGFNADLRSVPGGSAGLHLWIRMLFSCIVDADFLDTESFMDTAKHSGRDGFPEIGQLKTDFDRHMKRLTDEATPSLVNSLRAGILKECRDKAVLKPGIYTLTVPTGGGKTLSSMAFALEHAAIHGHERVIYAIPYTSIIEQTADVFRSIFGKDNLIEHHSNAESEPARENHRTRLAAENWDAPLVVTTNVQLFESLFASRTSRCRKLHNLVNSVIVLDEAQLLPTEFLKPIVDALKLLTAYGVTVVLCTATQPSLPGLEHAVEIIGKPDDLYDRLKRVDVRLPEDLHTPREWDSLASEISEHDTVLCVVNTKKSAQELCRRLPKGAIHLSSLMCGQHRSEIIEEIRHRLERKIKEGDDEPMRVVSTQLIEAGVDVDFPVVYRAMAGLDSIAQAAGRCNREGRLEKGEVHVFVPPIQPPPGLLRKGAGACKVALHGNETDPLSLKLFPNYFRQLHSVCDLDEKQIGAELLNRCQDNFPSPNFREAARKFRLIDDAETATLIVKYHGKNGVVDQWLAMLKIGGAERWLMRKLQRYAVTLYQRDLLRLQAQGDVEELFPGLYVQVSDVLYDPVYGVNVDGMPGDPAQLAL